MLFSKLVLLKTKVGKSLNYSDNLKWCVPCPPKQLYFIEDILLLDLNNE